jgi:hypothetical protein
MTRSVLARSYARSQDRGDREARSTLERWFEDSNVRALHCSPSFSPIRTPGPAGAMITRKLASRP